MLTFTRMRGQLIRDGLFIFPDRFYAMGIATCSERHSNYTVKSA